MEFKQKTVEDVPTTTPTTKVATATSKKAGKDTAANVWVNFTLCLETKAGIKRVSSGIPADAVFKRLFGDDFLEVLNGLSEEKLESITKKLSAENFAINIVTPSKPAKFEDLF